MNDVNLVHYHIYHILIVIIICINDMLTDNLNEIPHFTVLHNQIDILLLLQRLFKSFRF